MNDFTDETTVEDLEWCDLDGDGEWPRSLSARLSEDTEGFIVIVLDRDL